MKTVKMPVIARNEVTWQSNPPSFRATTRNPFVKLFSKLIVMCGMVIMFAVSGWGSNNPVVSLSCTPYTLMELNSGTQPVTCTISLDRAPDTNQIKIKVVSSGTATTATDYTAPSTTTFSFAKDTLTLSQTFTYSVKGDTAVEPDETIIASLADNGTNAVQQTYTFSNSAKTITIYTDDFSISSSSNHRAFAQIYNTNDNANIKIIGNSVLTTSTGCETGSNNDYNAVNADNDTNSSTFNSTSADLNLSSVRTGSDILYAGLYWQGRFSSSSNLSNNVGAARTVKLKLPGSEYQTLTSEYAKFNWSTISGKGDYQGVLNITQLVQANANLYASSTSGYNQTIWIADVKTDTGSKNLYGAWSIVLAYKDGTTTFKNLSVYDGYLGINTGTSATDRTVPLSGFLTPSTYPVNASFLIFGGEGDKYYGDSVTLSNSGGDKYLNNSGIHEVFNSSITDVSGNIVKNRTPDCDNTMGADIHTYNIGKTSSSDTTGIIETSQTSTTVKLSSFTVSPWPPAGFTTSDTQANSYDTFFPGVFAFSTDLYSPNMCYIEELYDSADNNISGVGVKVNKDDILKIRVTVKNNGSDTAKGVQVLNPFNDTSFPYVPNSTYYNNISASRVHATDSTGDDLFEYNASKVGRINLGSSASVSSGGDFVPISIDSDAYAVYEYNGTVKVIDQNFSNEYYAAYKSNIAGGLDYSNNPVKMESCSGERNSFWGYSAPAGNPGSIDLVDTDRYGVSYPSDANISTKIVNKPFDLKAVYLKNGVESTYNGTYSTNKTVDMSMMFWTANNDCSVQYDHIGDGVLPHNTSAITVGNNSQTPSTVVSFTIPKALKAIKIKTYAFDFGSIFNNASSLSCGSSSLTSSLCLVPACFNAEDNIRAAFPVATYPYINTCISGDGDGSAPCDQNAYTGSCGGKKSDVTISPAKYNNDIGCAMCIADAAGMYSCSKDAFAIRPKEFQSSLVNGSQLVAAEPTSIIFRANDYNNDATVDYNETEHTSFVADVNISDSIKSCAQASLNFSPDINFTNGTVTDNYTLGNVGDFNVSIHEINGSEFAQVDFDDTADIDRFIGDFNRTIKVIPDHFAVDGNITNGSDGFTYLSNFEAYPTAESRNVSASLDLNITAKAFDDSNTSNYTGNCYAKDGNMTINLANPIAVTPAGALTKMLWYDANHDVNGSRPLNGTTVYQLPLVASQFNSTDSNGTAEVNYLINFDRNQTKVVDPFTLGVDTIDYDDNDSVSADPVLNLDQDMFYVYGRLIPRDVRVFGTAVPAVASAWYEVYNTSSIGATALTPSRNTSQWFVNGLHDDLEGDGFVTQRQSGDTASTAVSPALGNGSIEGVETYNFGALSIGSFKAHIDTDPWLWHGVNALGYVDPVTGNTVVSCLNHPCFNINVVPDIGRGGSATSTEQRDKKDNKATSTGTGVTYDYTPATR